MDHNPSSTYHIHPSESSSSVIMTLVLTRNNYHPWSQYVKMDFISKNKMGFLTGTILIPAHIDPLYVVWECCNILIMYWLLNYLSQSIFKSVIYFDHVVDVWNGLKESFSQGDLLHTVEQLQEEVYGLKQGSHSVTKYSPNLIQFGRNLTIIIP